MTNSIRSLRSERSEMTQVELAERGGVAGQTVIEVFRLAEAPAAVAYLREGRARGKVVVSI